MPVWLGGYPIPLAPFSCKEKGAEEIVGDTPTPPPIHLRRTPLVESPF